MINDLSTYFSSYKGLILHATLFYSKQKKISVLCINSIISYQAILRDFNVSIHDCTQGLIYRWTEHSADFLKKNDHWGRKKGPPNYTPGVDFLDHALL